MNHPSLLFWGQQERWPSYLLAGLKEADLTRSGLSIRMVKNLKLTEKVWVPVS